MLINYVKTACMIAGTRHKLHEKPQIKLKIDGHDITNVFQQTFFFFFFFYFENTILQHSTTESCDANTYNYAYRICIILRFCGCDNELVLKHMSLSQTAHVIYCAFYGCVFRLFRKRVRKRTISTFTINP